MTARKHEPKSAGLNNERGFCVSLIPKPDGDGLLTATILCPGPSLANYKPPTGPERFVTIAVNRAVAIQPVDWWVALDSDTVAMLDRPPVAKRILMGMAAWGEAAVRFPAIAATLDHIPKAYLRADWLPGAQEFLGHSFLTAILLAAEIGADLIECWGVDLDGKKDFDGFSDRRQNRTPGHWALELELFERLTEVLAERDVCVTRMAFCVEAKS